MRRVVVIAGLLGLSVACSSSSRDHMLRVFFDNPPGHAAAPADTAAARSVAAPAHAAAAATAGPARSTHPPFEDRECASCHASSTSVGGQTAAVPVLQSTGDTSPAKLLKPVSELCVECHDDKAGDALAAAGRKVVHSPVEDGDCTACHDPHRSRFASLLKRGDPIENLCFDCHDRDDVLRSDPHADMKPEERICTDCHDPHASADEGLLK